MDQAIYLVTLVSTALVVVAAFSSLIAFRFGAPLLLLFLAIGLASGEDGLGIDFDNAPLAYFVGSLALAVILFDSGFGTPLKVFRQAAAPALTLATFGVVLTTGLFGAAAFYLTELRWLESFLLGAAVASTDAAAVFFLLRAGNVNLRDRVRATLEIESGTNDPIAIFLTITLVELIALGADPDAEVHLLDLALGFLVQMVHRRGRRAGGRLRHRAPRRSPEPRQRPAADLRSDAVADGLRRGWRAGRIGLPCGLSRRPRRRQFRHPRRFRPQALSGRHVVAGADHHVPGARPVRDAVAVPAHPAGRSSCSACSSFSSPRPIAVWLCLIPFSLQRKETAFISWVGLRGAVSILLAITPILGGLENGRMIFNTAFIIVLVSLVVQGWTVGPLARRLGLIVPARLGPLQKVELELPGSAHHELLAYTVVAGSPVLRGQRIPRWARPSLVVRDGRSIKFQDAGRLMARDHVYIFVPDRYPRLLDRLFASRTEVDPEDEDFFGAFAVDPDRPASRSRSPPTTRSSPKAKRAMTIGALMVARLGGHAEYADRVSLGPIELIVRDVDEKGRIISVGVALEPRAAAGNTRLLRRGRNPAIASAAFSAAARTRTSPPTAPKDTAAK